MIAIEYQREGRRIEERPETLEKAVAVCWQNLSYNADNPSFLPLAIVADGRRIESVALRAMVRAYAAKAGLPSPV